MPALPHAWECTCGWLQVGFNIAVLSCTCGLGFTYTYCYAWNFYYEHLLHSSILLLKVTFACLTLQVELFIPPPATFLPSHSDPHPAHLSL